MVDIAEEAFGHTVPGFVEPIKPMTSIRFEQNVGPLLVRPVVEMMFGQSEKLTQRFPQIGVGITIGETMPTTFISKVPILLHPGFY
jgi:hypothetical protein